MISNYAERIIQHYESVWSNSGTKHRLERGPIDSISSDFCVLEFPPSPSRDMWTYSTCCMSKPNDAPPIELHLFASSPSDSHIEILTAVAHYHRTGCRIDLGDSVNIGRPWLPGSKCGFGLISLPYLDGPCVENLVLSDRGVTVKCYWLVPITQREMEFKKSAGVDALERELERANFNYLDLMRKSVV